MDKKQHRKYQRVRTPTVLQMEAVECGAAALGIILAHYGRFAPLEELRAECGVSRDGSKAPNMLKAARRYGLEAKGFRLEIEELDSISLPVIIFWNFNHFLVLEGFGSGNRVFLNDPAMGPRVVTMEEFDNSYTGVVLSFKPGPEFKKGGQKRNVLRSLLQRIDGCRKALAYIVLAGLFLVIPGLVIPTFSRIFIDNILIHGMRSWLKPLIVGMVITAILRGILVWLQQYYMLRMETSMALSGSRNFFRHVFRLPIVFFSQRFAGDIASRVMLNDKIASLFSGQIAGTLISLPMIPFYALIMFQYDIRLTLLGISIALLNIVAFQYVARKRTDLNQSLQQEQGKMLGVSMNGLQMIETLKASGSESDFFAQWSGQQAKVVNTSQELGFSSQWLSAIPPLLQMANTVAILAAGGFLVMDGDLTVGMLVAFQSLMASFLQPVNDLVGLGSTLQETMADINRLDDVIRYPQDQRIIESENADRQPDNLETAKLAGYLELKNISFGYSRLEAPLIENFSIKLTPGSRVALVGASGSGKSTIAKLVSGLYEPWEGEILFDNKPIHEIPRHVINNSISLVDQDICLFEGTVRDNITMWDSSIPESDMVTAAEDACIHDDITERNGYFSGLEQNGQNFSGGQRQRMEIARALSINPTILVMDEATSSLDAETERLVDDNLRCRGCTCLIIAHRLSTIRDCDEIIVMDHGKVMERGTHEQLLNAGGLYADLIKIN
ncbi:MAG: NHLP family bacteriocin export ABC transporter peptidase/permease/ATPase subunit [Kiritimatiellae bacterium]|nr:NHLP family bacteriocin export ABC transporter peptidase/permease/ATPase subunit [Kiritimatiellia bacterium]MDD5521993.1 NHLP family bacteriocin export ABC transporter peptidase/permease/ATPase subunit [Kiritimatiellia bacterium]